MKVLSWFLYLWSRTVGYLAQRLKVGHCGVKGPKVRQAIGTPHASTAKYTTVLAAYRLTEAPLLVFRATINGSRLRCLIVV